MEFLDKSLNFVDKLLIVMKTKGVHNHLNPSSRFDNLYHLAEVSLQNYLSDLPAVYASTSGKQVVTFNDFFSNKFLIIQTIRKGITYRFFDQIKSVLPFTDMEWADYLNLSLKTLQRHKNDNDFYFKPIHTEKIIELAEVTHYGREVFGSREKFHQWLTTPSYALGNMTPAYLLHDSYGKDLVLAELNRIAHGIFA